MFTHKTSIIIYINIYYPQNGNVKSTITQYGKTIFSISLLSIFQYKTKTSMENSLNYYRIKTEWTAEKEDGSLVKLKTEELAYATSYTEAEKIAYALADEQNRSKFGSFIIEIVKTKISELLYNNILEHDDHLIGGLVCNYFSDAQDSVGIYSVKVIFTNIDEKTGKEKKSTVTIFTPATSNTDAAKCIHNYLKDSMQDYVIRDIKFDKAEAVLWPKDIQQSKMNSFA